eukprot:3282051-Pleurochrysis_carterae.AAC.1
MTDGAAAELQDRAILAAESTVGSVCTRGDSAMSGSMCGTKSVLTVDAVIHACVGPLPSQGCKARQE